jgi:hypothetical protein
LVEETELFTLGLVDDSQESGDMATSLATR